MIKLTDVISIQKLSDEKDDFGHRQKVWLPVATDIRARVMYKSGSEELEAGQIRAKRVVKIQLWSRPDIKEDMRITFGNEIFNIKAVLPDNQFRRFMMIEAEDDVR